VVILEILTEERAKLAGQLLAIEKAIAALEGTPVRARRVVHVRRAHSLAVRRRIGRGVKAAHRRRNGNK
jgi:hypothetical protein